MLESSGRLFRKVMLLLFAQWMFFSALSVFAAQAAPPTVPRDAKCPVCGMFVAKYPDWNASAVYRDGRKIFFDGPKDLCKYYLNPQKYDPTARRAEIVALSVRDYYSLAVIDARLAYFVVGSNVMGPMGRELIPFAKKGDAEGFQADHQGRRPIRFQEITPALLKTLD